MKKKVWLGLTDFKNMRAFCKPRKVFQVMLPKACKVALGCDFVQNIINKKIALTARAFRDLWSLVKS